MRRVVSALLLVLAMLTPTPAYASVDAGTDLARSYVGARYYASQTGRFTSVDPGHVNGDIFDPQSWNAYAYARNNPLKYTDPTGTTYEICAQGVSQCQQVSDQYFAILQRNPGAGIQLFGGYIYAGGKGAGTYRQTSIDPTFDSFAFQTGRLAAAELRYATIGVGISAGAGAAAGLAAGALSGGLTADSILGLTSRVLDANKLNHLFAKAAHKLGPLVTQLGSREAAGAAIERAVQAEVGRRGLSGVYQVTVNVAGHAVTVTGKVVDGVARIGTAFVR